MPPVPTYDQAYAQLGAVYDPQVQSVNTQIAGLQPLQDAQQAGLDQAKVNAFRDITTSANAKGMLFSGFSPDQQAQYVGTKYLPAVANLKQTFANQRTTLLDKINQINAQRSQQASQTVSAAQNAASLAAYRNAQLQLGYARLAQSGARSGQPTAAQMRQAVIGHIQDQFVNLRGKDGKVSNETWAGALNDAAAVGIKPQDFWQQYGQYVNRKYANSYAGYSDGYGQRYTR